MLRFTVPRLILCVLLSSAFIGGTPAWSGPPDCPLEAMDWQAQATFNLKG